MRPLEQTRLAAQLRCPAQQTTGGNHEVGLLRGPLAHQHWSRRSSRLLPRPQQGLLPRLNALGLHWHGGCLMSAGQRQRQPQQLP